MPATQGAKPLPSIFISKDEVSKRINNYLTNKRPILGDAIGGADTKSAWYSLAQFEDLMREMYYLNADGLRVYFGAYDNDDEDYPGMLTVVFVPTYMDEGTGKHTDIVIDDEPDFEGRINATSDTEEMGVIRKNFDTIGLCPPSCGDHAFAYPLS